MFLMDMLVYFSALVLYSVQLSPHLFTLLKQNSYQNFNFHANTVFSAIFNS